MGFFNKINVTHLPKNKHFWNILMWYCKQKQENDEFWLCYNVMGRDWLIQWMIQKSEYKNFSSSFLFGGYLWLFVCFKGKKRKLFSENILHWFTPQIPTADWHEAGGQGLSLDFPREWQALNYLSHHLVFLRVSIQQKATSRARSGNRTQILWYHGWGS